jgi:predicted ribosome quality control (RQC) complex YloA/Tae2 family protein
MHMASTNHTVLLPLRFSQDGYLLYMGKDKYENEDLIRYGHPEDVWFHVDDLSSAHVYLRQKPGEKLDDISPQLLLECCALVKVRAVQACE